MIPAPEICESARLARDPRFDGRFYIGVLTTGIYCRPVCPARTPAEANVRYFATSASAQEAGFRPCLRCRPETARRLPEWTISSQSVVRGLRMIDAGFLQDHCVAELAARLYMSARHLNRLFQQELGATPKSLAKVRRVHLAKRLIDHSQFSFSDVAMRAGFGSVRRFNDEIREAFGRTPRDLRSSRRPVSARGVQSARGVPSARGVQRDRGVQGDRGRQGAGEVQLHLPVREPYHRTWVFGFLKQRALPGIEEVVDEVYRRRLPDTAAGECWLEVAWENAGLCLRIPAECALDFADLLCRVRRVFDLDADPAVVDAHLSRDPLLSRIVHGEPGLRVPGAWDGFETAVRAILGQQVSVARATALAGKLCTQFGAGGFPTPQQLMNADIAAIGMPGKRGGAIRELAQAVVDGRLVLNESADHAELSEALCDLPGVGPWTAGYIGMRVARDPDAFVESDWVVLKMLDVTAAAARRQAEAWRPWRAYAVMYLWRMAQERRQQTGGLSAETPAPPRQPRMGATV